MKVNCPGCKKEIEWNSANPFRPFCSKQCQLIDLGEWANEEKAIPGKQNEDAAELPLDIEDIEELLSQQDDPFFRD